MQRNLRQAVEILTVGFPFCAFKVLTGLVFLDRAWLQPVGWFLIALGAVDAVINAVNLASFAAGRSPVLGVCLTQVLARRFRPNRPAWDDLGASVDVVVSFVLVAVMIGFALLPALPPWALNLWSAAVVLNVLGAGFGRLTSSLDSLKDAPSP